MTLIYDPLASNPANYIVNELQVTNGNAVIFPIEHPFYALDFELWATAIIDSIEVKLLDTLNYSFSPSFMNISSDVGKEAYSYIVLLKPELWSDVRITYRGAGGKVDSTLIEEILKTGNLDKKDPNIWLNLNGDNIALRTNELDITYRDKGIIETVTESIDLIANGLNRVTVLPTTNVGTDAQVLVDAAEVNAVVALSNAEEALNMVGPTTIVSPPNGFIDFNSDYTIDISGYTTNKRFIGTHTATDWEISRQDDFFSIAHASYDDVNNLLSYYPLGLTPSTLYYVRVRLISDGHKGRWSDVISFTTSAILRFIVTPTITSPTDESIGINPLPVLQSSSFDMEDGYENHIVTDWEIATDLAFTNIIYQVLDSIDLLSHTVTIDLNKNTVYYVRCRHKTTSLISNYSTPISFTTLTTLESIKLIGGVSNEEFHSILVDPSTGNYVCVGSSDSTGAGLTDAYIAIFDVDLNLINDKLIGGTSNDRFFDIIKDTNTGNYVCIGLSADIVTGFFNFYIAIFDTSLNLINNKTVSGTGNDELRGITFDPITGNYICVGYSDSTGAGLTDSYIAIFDSSLNLINDKLIGSTGDEEFSNGIKDPNTNNFIVIGGSTSVGTGLRNSHIAIFDTSLNLIKDRIVGGSGEGRFVELAFDPSTSNYVCIGESDSAGAGLKEAYIAIFDTDLNLINDKLIGGTGNEIFRDIIIDPSTSNYVCIGESDSAGAGLKEAYIAIFDTDLNLINDKLIGGTGNEIFRSITIDPSTGNYIVAGHSDSTGAGLNDAVIMTFLKDLTLSDGAIPGITELIVSTPTLTETSPAFTETAPVLTETSPVFTEATPALTETSPAFTETFSTY